MLPDLAQDFRRLTARTLSRGPSTGHLIPSQEPPPGPGVNRRQAECRLPALRATEGSPQVRGDPLSGGSLRGPYGHNIKGPPVVLGGAAHSPHSTATSTARSPFSAAVLAPVPDVQRSALAGAPFSWTATVDLGPTGTSEPDPSARFARDLRIPILKNPARIGPEDPRVQDVNP